jgi:lipoate---protein ligase
VGALPGGRFLTGPSEPEQLTSARLGGSVPGCAARAGDVVADGFDVEVFRGRPRTVVVREVERPVLVLGSRQGREVVNEPRAARAGVQLARRRSGGGAVLLRPGAQIWADIWIPRSDPLWSDEPSKLAVAVGEWWAGALDIRGSSVHRQGMDYAPGGDLVCFAGVGPGEVLVGGRKLVGLAQWRSREGALVHGCAYRTWDPLELVDLLAMGEEARNRLTAGLRDAAVGLDSLGITLSSGVAALIGTLPQGADWDVLFAGASDR